MPEKVMPGPVESPEGIREAVCIHTRKIYDSCREEHGAVSRFATFIKRKGGHCISTTSTKGDSNHCL